MLSTQIIFIEVPLNLLNFTQNFLVSILTVRATGWGETAPLTLYRNLLNLHLSWKESALTELAIRLPLVWLLNICLKLPPFSILGHLFY